MSPGLAGADRPRVGQRQRPWVSARVWLGVQLGGRSAAEGRGVSEGLRHTIPTKGLWSHGHEVKRLLNVMEMVGSPGLEPGTKGL